MTLRIPKIQHRAKTTQLALHVEETLGNKTINFLKEINLLNKI